MPAGKPDALRRELGAFLRSRRERLSSAESTPPADSRRRTPGLRREEVAALAGVSTTWYAWLEQGRVDTSDTVLLAVADALKLNPDETAHVLSFASRVDPADASPRYVSPNLASVVESLTPNPAVVIDPHWDFLAWNRAYSALLTDLARLPAGQRNLLWLVFCWPPARTLLARWEEEAKSLLGQFRAKAARHPTDRRYAQLTDDLLADPDAARWLRHRETIGFHPAVRHFRHPTAGDLRLRYAKLAAVDEPSHHLLVYTPDGPATRDALAALTLSER